MIIFEPPAALTGGDAEVWIAASGGNGSVADSNWGGADVWISLDGATYGQVGTITAPAREGVLTAALPAYSGTNPDTADTLGVDLTRSAGTLQSTTAAAAANGETLIIVDGELLAFKAATLTGPYRYGLTTLYRGLYGTAAAGHAAGAKVARLDDAVFKLSLLPPYVGRQIFFKLQSFNVFGAGQQSLSACVAYSYTPTGAALDHPVARSMLIGSSIDFGDGSGVGQSLADDFGDGSGGFAFTVDLGA